ncbi:uncharacterized protein BJ212DRAFT_1336690 [Suillus subaureus]|uniref:Uncharacterized protein n=1 Tax=Suillus subaureus TaxID=48587 RepID=A0A9P7JGC0_9AGAM|nr:uncharacterized protein BJ212DRAFT_1336690 [Suillus subaureus]KAG1820976.1 hypothetical protein BJ212DRAFT_1336690 [Suillus subaureus]
MGQANPGFLYPSLILTSNMQRSLLFNVLAFMVVLAVAYPMSGAITERSSVARHEDEARGVYFPISYDNNKKCSEDDVILYPMLLKERSSALERSEDDVILYPMLFKERSSAVERSEDDAILYPMKQ